MQKDKNIKVLATNTWGRQYSMRFNVLTKPFDNAKVRQAVLVALSQKEFLDANSGNPDYYKECKSVFPCGSPLESTKGWEDKLTGNIAKAKEMLASSGYDGTPAVLLHQTDTAGHNNLATVAKPQLEKAGFKVDLQAMDWQTLVARRAKKDPIASGGWSAYFTSWGAPDIMNPVSNAFLNASCDKATFGWACDEALEKLRDAYAKETDPAKQKAIAEQVQLRVLEYPTHAPLGQFTNATALRTNVNGVLQVPSLALWNIEKK
jgi:peptide/nickel transport system substrate-binding protein